jgi:Cu(I)/Ag(I) efflux system membrane fusion protein
MRVKSSFLSVVAITGALALLATAGVMCQKSQSAKTETSQAAVAEKAPVHDAMMGSDMGVTTDTSFNKTGAATEYYTCTMHPQVHQAKPGKCPICGMSLVFHKADKTIK